MGIIIMDHCSNLSGPCTIRLAANDKKKKPNVKHSKTLITDHCYTAYTQARMYITI